MSEYYTVSQFAEITGKDPGNIRRMLIKGTLNGEKVGKQWLIPKDTKVPEDRRVKTGNYHNWRQKIKLNSEHPALSKKLNTMCQDLGKIYKNKISEIILYGSYARGQESEESDIDLALMLKSDQTEKQHDRMTDIVVEYELDLGITLSVITINCDHYREWKSTLPFYKNVEKEGIVLWKN